MQQYSIIFDAGCQLKARFALTKSALWVNMPIDIVWFLTVCAGGKGRLRAFLWRGARGLAERTVKILYIASTFGHLAAFHRPYLRWFAARGCEVHAAAAGEPDTLDGVSRMIALPFEKSMASPRNLAAAVRLRRLLREEGYQMLSLHTALAAFFARLAVQGMGAKRPCVMNTVHGYLFDAHTPPAKRALLLGAEKCTARVTDYLLTMNRQDREIAETHRLGRRIYATDGMGVDFSRFQPATPAQRAAARRSLGIPEDALVLVYAAEFSGRKNQAMLIDAMTGLPENVWLLLPGRGALLEACSARAKAGRAAARTVFPGFVPDMERCYHAADVCVSASRSEGLPFNIMEAMHCGLPVAAIDVKGHEDLLRDTGAGLLFPHDDTAALARAVRALAAADRRRAMGAAAHRSVQRYALERVFPQLTGLYAQALDGWLEQQGGNVS